MFEAKELGFNVGDKALLKNVNLSFEQGKIYALVGHNGSGKSTLLKLLAKQQKATSGDIYLNDKPVSEWSEKGFARQIAYLPQHLPLTDNLSGYDLVSFGRYPWHGLLGRLTAQDKQLIDEAMALTDTRHYSKRLVDTLSGGERQRMWLAMLLAQRTNFLLLDEPLAALDISHQVEMLSLIKTLSSKLNLGVIIVIHDINLAARFCDHIVALHQGELMIEGAVDTVFQESVLAQIYEVPMHITPHSAGYPVAMPGEVSVSGMSHQELIS